MPISTLGRSLSEGRQQGETQALMADKIVLFVIEESLRGRGLVQEVHKERGSVSGASSQPTTMQSWRRVGASRELAPILSFVEEWGSWEIKRTPILSSTPTFNEAGYTTPGPGGLDCPPDWCSIRSVYDAPTSQHHFYQAFLAAISG